MVSQIDDVLLLISGNRITITVEEITALIVIIIAGSLIGFTSEGAGEVLEQIIIFMILLITISVFVNPINVLFSSININDVILRIRKTLPEYIFIFLLLLFTSVISSRISSK